MHFWVFLTFSVALLVADGTCAVASGSQITFVGGRVCDAVAISEGNVLDFVLQNYSVDARPVRNSKTVVDIRINFTINGIKEFDEKRNSLTLDGYFSLGWIDEMMMWQKFYPYNCVTNVVLQARKVWKPDIIIVGGMYHELETSSKVSIWSDGQAYYYPAGDITIDCELDLTLFPFDSQICSVVLESWNYPLTHQTFSLSSQPGVIKSENFWQEHSLWEIADNRTKVEYILLLKRKPLFYVINIVIPSVIIALAELSVFVLPVDEVIKVHISFTCLLAYGVFEDMTIKDIPRSSDTFPLLSLYIDLQMAYIGLIALLGEGIVFVFIRKSVRNKHSLPPKPLMDIFQLIGKVFWVDAGSLFDMARLANNKATKPLSRTFSHLLERRFADMVLVSSMTGHNEHVPTFSVPNVRFKENYDTSKDAPPTLASQMWLYMAEVLERVNMVVYLIAVSVTPLVMFSCTKPEKVLK